jgi:hypothetical protein
MQPNQPGGVEETKQATSSSSGSRTSSGKEFIPDESSSSGVDSSPAITRSRAALTLDIGTEETDLPPSIMEEGEQEDGAEAQIQDPDIDTIFRPLEETIEEETIEFEQTEEEVLDPLNTSVADLIAKLTGVFGTPPRPVSPQQQQDEDYIFTETPLPEGREVPFKQDTEPQAQTDPPPERLRPGSPVVEFFRGLLTPGGTRPRSRQRPRPRIPRRFDSQPLPDPTRVVPPPQTRVPSAVSTTPIPIGSTPTNPTYHLHSPGTRPPYQVDPNMAGHVSIPYMNYPNGVVPQTIAEWQTHVTRLLDGAAAPILDTTQGHVAITGTALFAKFQEIIDRDDTSVLGRYLAGYNINTFSDILSMPDNFIIANNPTANPADTPYFTDAQLLIQFCSFNCVQMNCNGNHRIHWDDVTPEMFTIFVESYYSPTTTNYVSPAAVVSSTITTVNAAVGATTLTRTARMSATSMFQRRNIKMNKDDYPKLVKETGSHKFSTDVTTVASVYGIGNVLNPTYAPVVPTDPDEVTLFHLQK